MVENKEKEVTEATEATEEQPADLKLVDLENVLRIIDVAASRGAFRSAEFTGVGNVRDRIAKFVEAVSPKEEEATDEETDEGNAEVETASAAAVEEEKPKRQPRGRRRSS